LKQLPAQKGRELHQILPYYFLVEEVKVRLAVKLFSKTQLKMLNSKLILQKHINSQE
jgi:hypothetical protein